MSHLHLAVTPKHFTDRYGRRVLTDAGEPGMDGREGIGSETERARNRVAAAIYANCEKLDRAQLDEIAAWIDLYRSGPDVSLDKPF